MNHSLPASDGLPTRRSLRHRASSATGSLGSVLTLNLGLWLLVVTFGLLDVAMTIHGVRTGFIELNPIGAVGIATFGVWSLFVAKGLALCVGVVAWGYLSRRRLLVPVIFATFWGTAVLANGLILLG